MDLLSAAAYVYAVLTGIVIGFQLALTAGAPWGAYAMAGKYPGKYPLKMRVFAVAFTPVLAVQTAVVLSHARIAFNPLAEFSEWAIFVVFGLGCLSAIMNIITPSKKERMLWGPVSCVMAGCAGIVAFS
jgi:hypothetical protein